MTSKSEYEAVYRQLFSAGWGNFVEAISQEPVRYHNLPSVEDDQSFTGRLPYDSTLFNNGDPFAAIANMASHTRNQVHSALVETLGSSTMPPPDKKSYKLVYGSKTGKDSATLWDLGGGTGSKLVKEYTDVALSKKGKPSYNGPRAVIFDRIDDPTGGVHTEWGVNFKKWDAEKDPVPIPPPNTLLTSVNFATNVDKIVLEKIMEYDGVHLVPNCKTMVAKGVSKRNGDRIETSIGGQSHIEYYHEFPLDPELGPKPSGFYGHMFCFSYRNIEVDETSKVRTSVNESAFPLSLCEKPDRYATTTSGFSGPYKLKYDGNECMLRMSSTSVTLLTRFIQWDYDVCENKNKCATEIHLFGELVSEMKTIIDESGAEDVEIETRLYPHLVYQAGRRCGEIGLKTFLSKTQFNIPGVTVVQEIPLYGNIQDALMASYNSLISDGIIALGGNRHVAAKLYETVDIRACHTKTLSVLAMRVYPRNLVLASYKEPMSNCRGAKGCDTCPIYEYAIRFNGTMVILNQVRRTPRRDKLAPNALDRIVKMLPDGKTGKDPNTIWDELGDGVAVQLKTKEMRDTMPGKIFHQVGHDEGKPCLKLLEHLDEAHEMQELGPNESKHLAKHLKN